MRHSSESSVCQAAPCISLIDQRHEKGRSTGVYTYPTEQEVRQRAARDIRSGRVVEVIETPNSPTVSARSASTETTLLSASGPVTPNEDLEAANTLMALSKATPIPTSKLWSYRPSWAFAPFERPRPVRRSKLPAISTSRKVEGVHQRQPSQSLIVSIDDDLTASQPSLALPALSVASPTSLRSATCLITPSTAMFSLDLAADEVICSTARKRD